MSSGQRRLLFQSVVGLSLTALFAGCSAGTLGSPGNPTPPISSVTVSDSSETRMGTTTQFSATVSNASSQTVTWQVNGITGSDHA